MTVKITIPTFVSEPNCLAVNHLRGQALYEQMSAGVFEDFLTGAHFTNDEKALIVYKGEQKVFIIHAINAIVDEKTLSSQVSLAFKVDSEFWKLFQERCPDLADL